MLNGRFKQITSRDGGLDNLRAKSSAAIQIVDKQGDSLQRFRWAVLGVVLLTIAIRLPSLLHPQPIDSESMYSVVANEIVDGGRPYLDAVERKLSKVTGEHKSDKSHLPRFARLADDKCVEKLPPLLDFRLKKFFVHFLGKDMANFYGKKITSASPRDGYNTYRIYTRSLT